MSRPPRQSLWRKVCADLPSAEPLALAADGCRQGIDAVNHAITHKADATRSVLDFDLALLARTQLYLAARHHGAVTEPTDEAAWHSFFCAFNPFVCALVRVNLRVLADLADAVQEAWSVIITKLPNYLHDPEKGHFADWIAVVVHNAVANFCRSASRVYDRLVQEFADSLQVSVSDLSAGIERAESHQQIIRGLAAFRDRVEPIVYWVVLLKYVGGQSMEGVATRLDLTPGQVRGVLARALPRLRLCLRRATGAESGSARKSGDQKIS